jgi:CheY-like chemotaxis protein
LILIVDNDGKNPVRIMVCDDDSSMRESIVRLIQKVADEKKVAVEVKESINGLECLNQIYQAFVSGCNFEAVLLDEAMPFMKGSKCMNILRDMNKEGFMNKIRKISISSFEDLETIKYIKAQGCDEFLPKPHNKEAISKFIESLVN